MVPKTNQSSSSSKGGSSGGEVSGGSSFSSGASSELYSKMHDLVLSRTPDQSLTARFLHQVMRSSVATISQEIGWNTAHLSALDVLSDLTIRYMLQVAKQTKKYTEHYGRTEVSAVDIALGFKDMNISIPELEEYVQNFDNVQIPKEVPYFPVPRKTDLNFLRPGSSEVLTRPVHVHEYMPPMIFEQTENELMELDDEDKDKEKDVVPVEVEENGTRIKLEQEDKENGETPPVNISNGIVMMPLVLEEPSQVPEVAAELVVADVVITEEIEVKTEPPPASSEEPPPLPPPAEPQPPQQPSEGDAGGANLLTAIQTVQNDLEESSDDDIEPASAKFASVFATFKSTKKLESASENAALKRVRKMLAEQGHPVREVTSVIMTSSGFLSESREGRLPDCKPPKNRDFFDHSPPPPEPKKKIPTMKKILEGVKKVKTAKGVKGQAHAASKGGPVHVKGTHPRADSDNEENDMEESPGLFGTMDKIQIQNPHSVDPLGLGGVGIGTGVGLVGEDGVLQESTGNIPKKMSKQEKKLLQKKTKKELKALLKKNKTKSKDKHLIKQAKLFESAKDRETPPGASSKSKLTIFTKKRKAAKALLPDGTVPSGLGSSSSKKRKKDKKNKFGLKDLKVPLTPLDEKDPTIMSMVMGSKVPARGAGTELIDSDEDFSLTEGNQESAAVVPPMILSPASFQPEDVGLITKKKIKKDASGKLRALSSGFAGLPEPSASTSKKFNKAINMNMLPPPPGGLPPIPKTKLGFLKRALPHPASGDLHLTPGGNGPPIKKKRGRPKKIWADPGVVGGDVGVGVPAASQLQMGPGGSMSLPAAQLASIGKSLMIKEPTLKMDRSQSLKLMKTRKDHIAQDPLHPPVKPPTISPSKIASTSAAATSADLLKRLPAQPGLIPDSSLAPARLPKELPSSISITPAGIPSPQKDSPRSTSSGGFQSSLPPNVCSSVTITRIDMSHQQKLPSPYDDSITPGIGPPPGLIPMDGTGSKRSSKTGKGVPPPPPLQIPIQAETESGITITPIMMGGGGGGHGHATSSDHSHGHSRYEHLPPPPPLQERPPQKHSMLAKLDEELSSASSLISLASTSTITSTSASKEKDRDKEQRKKDKEKRKELKKEKKKKAKDKDRKSKDKEKKKKKKDNSGETLPLDDEPPLAVVAVVPKLTLKLGGHSNTPTPVDSPNPPQVYHDPLPPKKLTFKGLGQAQDVPKPPKLHKPPQHHLQEVEDTMEVARFAPLVTRPQKPARAAKVQAVAACVAVAMGATLGSHQDIVQFPAPRDSVVGGVSGAGGRDASAGGGNKRGRGRPPKGGLAEAALAQANIVKQAPLPAPKQSTSLGAKSQATKSSLTVLETETVGCIIDEDGNKIWICPKCGRQDDGSPMIGCDSCDDWYHFTCVGITQEPKEDEQWFCQRCLKRRKSQDSKPPKKKQKTN